MGWERNFYTFLEIIGLTAMTYNFDPDKWYDDELFIIQTKFNDGEPKQKEYDLSVLEWVQKHEEMWKRL